MWSCSDRLSARRRAACAALALGLGLAGVLGGAGTARAQRAEPAAVGAALAVVAPPVPLLPVAAEREPAPAFAVQEFDWLDTARQRAVPVRLYLPALASARGRCR